MGKKISYSIYSGILLTHYYKYMFKISSIQYMCYVPKESFVFPWTTEGREKLEIHESFIQCNQENQWVLES